jgi:hypothetical protein
MPIGSAQNLYVRCSKSLASAILVHFRKKPVAYKRKSALKSAFDFLQALQWSLL